MHVRVVRGGSGSPMRQWLKGVYKWEHKSIRTLSISRIAAHSA